MENLLEINKNCNTQPRTQKINFNVNQNPFSNHRFYDVTGLLFSSSALPFCFLVLFFLAISVCVSSLALQDHNIIALEFPNYVYCAIWVVWLLSSNTILSCLGKLVTINPSSTTNIDYLLRIFVQLTIFNNFLHKLEKISFRACLDGS